MWGKVHPMIFRPYILSAALTLPVVLPGCASEARHAETPIDVANARAMSAKYQDRGREVLILADRQMKDLERLRDSSTDPFVQAAMSRQVEDLRVRSDILIDEMTMGDAPIHDAAIRADVANLERTMNGTANAEQQAEPKADGP